MNSALSDRSARPFLACLFLLGCGAIDARADAIGEWSQLFVRHVSTGAVALPPHYEARTHALAHLALHEAAREATRGAPRNATTADAARAAVAAAGQAVVAELIPSGEAAAEALAAKQLSAIAEGAEKTRGRAGGRAAATRVCRERALDRWNELDLANGVEGLLPDFSDTLVRAIAAGGSPPRSRWLKAKPFLLRSAAQFAAAVPAVTAVDGTVRRNHALLESKLFEAVDRSLPGGVLERTWSGRPLAEWNRIARAMAEGSGCSLAESARLHAVLNAALADAMLAALHWRFTLGTWSSTLVETWGDGRGLPMAPSDTTSPAVFDGIESGTAVLQTRRVVIAPLPNYPSTAATLAGAAQAAIAECLGGDVRGFNVEMGGGGASAERVRRSYGGVGEAARECAFVVTLDGRHTREAAIAGHQLGAAVGKEVARRFKRTRK